jgi:hypothetical protein
MRQATKKPSASTKAPLAKAVPTTMRFDLPIKEAMERAAKEDRRTVTSLTMKILEVWLKEHDYLK